MRRLTLMLLALLSAAMPCALAQNMAQATPQTRATEPASSGTAPTPPMNHGAGRRGSGGRGSHRSGTATGSQRGTGGTATSAAPTTPAAIGNGSVGVIGDTNGDGLLDRNGNTSSAALPGIPMLHNAMGIAPGTPIHVRVDQSIDSGHAHNGDTVRGVLTAPLGNAAAGSPVTMTVVAAAPAGELTSYGVLSLQVISVNGEQILSQIITAQGKEGPKVLPDAAPARGTDAVFTPDQPITLPAA